MLWLIFFAFVTLIAIWGDQSISHKSYKGWRIALLLIISYVVAFGSIVCEDNELYAFFYSHLQLSNISNIDISITKTLHNHYELGYLLLNYFAKLLHLGVPGFFFLVALIVNGLFINFIFKYKNAPLVIIYLILTGICIQQGNLVRNYLAAAVFAFSIQYLISKEWIKYLFCIVVATSFHTTAMLLLLFLPLCFFDLDNKGWFKYILYGLYGLSVLVMLGGITLPFLEYASLLVTSDSYVGYVTDTNTIGMEFSMLRVILFNGMALFVLLTQVKENPILTSVVIMEVVLTNFSVSFPNLSRLYVLYDVVSITFFFHSLSLVNPKWKTSIAVGTAIKSFFVAYCIVVFMRDYVLSDNVLMLSKTYSVFDFFSF